jgi:hypothetical protein
MSEKLACERIQEPRAFRDRIELLSRDIRYARNVYMLRCEPGVEDHELMKFIEDKRIDHDSFGYDVIRANGGVALLSVYTD